jgi:hypothetical protein
VVVPFAAAMLGFEELRKSVARHWKSQAIG